MTVPKTILIALCFVFSTVSLAGNFTKIDVATTATINKIYFAESGYGWAVTSDGELLSSFDGGKTWNLREVSKKVINDIHISGRTGYLAGERGLIMKSTNRGASWADMSQGMKFNFVGVGIINDSSAIVCGTDQNSMSKTKGVIYQTVNRGKLWKKQRHLGNGYTDLVVQQPRKVYILASKKAFHSINSGINYFHGKYSGSRLAWGFDFIDDWGFVVGHKGYFARSTTHGRKWEDVDFGVTKNLYAVEMIDKYSGVAVGEDGIIIYFNDSGDRFTVSHCGYDEDLKTVCVTDDKIYAGGKNGTLLVKERFPKVKDN